MSTTGQAIHHQFARARRLSTRFRHRVEGLPIRAEHRKAGTPLPPGRLMHTIGGTEDVRWFVESGRTASDWIRATIERHGARLDRMRGILDFGCGVGRVTRNLADLEKCGVVGLDQNAKLVAWCRANLPFAEFGTNTLDAPLPLAEASIDFAFALSVFTHLPSPMQDFFIGELRRVLRPGGLLLFTAHGDCYRDHLSEADRAAYDEGMLVVRRGDRPGGNDCAAFHPPRFVASRMSDGFEILEHRPEGAVANPRQDSYLFRKG